VCEFQVRLFKKADAIFVSKIIYRCLSEINGRTEKYNDFLELFSKFYTPDALICRIENQAHFYVAT
jgi:hypothetical protein